MTNKVIQLVKNGKWFIPYNRAGYKALAKLGFPCTRIHDDARGALSLVLNKKGIDVDVIPFIDIRRAFQEKIKTAWLRDYEDQWDAKFTSSSMTLRTRKRVGKEDALKRMTRLKPRIEDFLTRWGLTGEVICSESSGTCKLYVSYKWSTHRPPVIKVARDVLNDKKQIIQLGAYRILTSTDKRKFYWWLEAKAAAGWQPVKHGQCLLTEVSDPTPLLRTLMVAYNKE